MSATNRIFAKNGKKSRFKEGHKTWNRKERVQTRARKTGSAYWLIYKPEHPNATKKGYIREHRWIMEQELGRYLDKNEEIHHINYDGLDNRLENLIVVSGLEHKRIHLKDSVHARWNNKKSPR